MLEKLLYLTQKSIYVLHLSKNNRHHNRSAIFFDITSFLEVSKLVLAGGNKAFS